MGPSWPLTQRRTPGDTALRAGLPCAAYLVNQWRHQPVSGDFVFQWPSMGVDGGRRAALRSHPSPHHLREHLPALPLGGAAVAPAPSAGNSESMHFLELETLMRREGPLAARHARTGGRGGGGGGGGSNKQQEGGGGGEGDIPVAPIRLAASRASMQCGVDTFLLFFFFFLLLFFLFHPPSQSSLPALSPPHSQFFMVHLHSALSTDPSRISPETPKDSITGMQSIFTTAPDR